MHLRPRNQKSLDDIRPEEIVRACEQNYIDYWRSSGRAPYANFSDEGGITRCITGLPQEIFNVVLSCRLHHREVDQKLDAMIGQLRAQRVTLIWHVGQTTEPGNLGEHLEDRGYPNDYNLTAMAVDLEKDDTRIKLPENVAVKTVTGQEDSREWVECLTKSWESPPEVAAWMLPNPCFNISAERDESLSLPRTMYLGLLDGRPVSAAMLFWSADIAGLQAVGTVHSGRGKGMGAAVVRAALDGARSLGFRYVVVLSTVEGVGLYKKVGFKAFGKLPEHSMDFR